MTDKLTGFEKWRDSPLQGGAWVDHFPNYNRDKCNLKRIGGSIPESDGILFDTMSYYEDKIEYLVLDFLEQITNFPKDVIKRGILCGTFKLKDHLGRVSYPDGTESFTYNGRVFLVVHKLVTGFHYREVWKEVACSD